MQLYKVVYWCRGWKRRIMTCLSSLMEAAANVLSRWCFISWEWGSWAEFWSTTIVFKLHWLLSSLPLGLCHFAQNDTHLTSYLTSETQTNCETAAPYFCDSVWNPARGWKGKKKINLLTWQRPESGVIPMCVNVILPETQFNITFFFSYLRNDLVWISSFDFIWIFWTCEYAGASQLAEALQLMLRLQITLRCAPVKYDRQSTRRLFKSLSRINGSAKVSPSFSSYNY